MENKLIEKANKIISKILEVPLSEWNTDSFTLNYKGYEVGFTDVATPNSSQRTYLYLIKDGTDKVLIANTMVDFLFDKACTYMKQIKDEKKLKEKAEKYEARFNLLDEVFKDISLD